MNGKFLNRDVKYLKDLIEVAQTQKIVNIKDVGKTTNKVVSVIQTVNRSGENYLDMVTRSYYDMMDFSTEEQLKAYNNFSDQVRRVTGAYSNKFSLA